jgi:hypothetical protein
MKETEVPLSITGRDRITIRLRPGIWQNFLMTIKLLGFGVSQATEMALLDFLKKQEKQGEKREKQQ